MHSIKLFFFLFSVFFSINAYGQKELKVIKKTLKEKSYSKVIDFVDRLEHTDSIIGGNPKLYNLGQQAAIALNDIQNERMYLKQNCDTSLFFTTLYAILKYTYKCDSTELHKWNLHKKYKFKFRKINRKANILYSNNLITGADYFFSKKQYSRTLAFLLLYKNEQTIVDSINKIKSLQNELRPFNQDNMYKLLYSAYITKKFDIVKTYITPSILTGNNNFVFKILSIIVNTYGATDDPVNYRKFLKLGIKKFPNNPIFFTKLIDFYNAKGNFAESLQESNNMLKFDSLNIYFLNAKFISLVNLGKNEAVITTGKKILSQDSTLMNIDYFMGMAYFNLGHRIALPTSITSQAYKKAIEKRHDLYKKAESFLEKYKNIAPNDVKKWGSPLYSIYLTLNKGDKFEEISHILGK